MSIMIRTRKELEDIEKQILAPYAVMNASSQGRKYEEEKDPYRLDFQRDRDRIIHSHAFRRLKDKTQVFVSHYGDHYRNRLTHTIEVAQLSRDIARNLGVNEDLAETIALAHDLGHTPFGHAGEETLSEILSQYDFTFEHNEQSKRMVTVLEKKSSKYPGLNLSWEVLDGMSKHQTIYDQAEKVMKGGLSIEAQIVNICDEIAYQNHDMDDGFRSGLIKIEELEDLEIFKIFMQEEWKELPLDDYFALCHNQIIKNMVNDVYEQTKANLKDNNIQRLDDVYASSQPIVEFSPNMKKVNKELRNYLFDRFYHHIEVKKQAERGQKIIEFLFDYYMNQPTEEMKELVQTTNDPLQIIVKDYIAGMTDAYAEKQFNL